MHMTNRREKAPDRAVSEGRILVAGAGTMGYGIAAACALGGFQVVMTSRRKESLDKGLSNARRDLSQMAKDGLITREEAAAALERIQVSTDLSAGRSAAFVLETITEDLAAKQELLSQLDKLCPPETIFASDISTLSIAALGRATKRPDRVIGLHFFTPVPIQKLAEVIRSVDTSDGTFSAACRLAGQLGKTVVQAPDRPGFIVNRVASHTWNEALQLIAEGVSPQDIDTAMKLGTNAQLGPAELIDLCGADTMLNVIETLYDGFRDPKFRPNPLLKKMVEAGRLGRKTGRGFYDYKEGAT